VKASLKGQVPPPRNRTPAGVEVPPQNPTQDKPTATAIHAAAQRHPPGFTPVILVLPVERRLCPRQGSDRLASKAPTKPPLPHCRSYARIAIRALARQPHLGPFASEMDRHARKNPTKRREKERERGRKGEGGPEGPHSIEKNPRYDGQGPWTRHPGQMPNPGRPTHQACRWQSACPSPRPTDRTD